MNEYNITFAIPRERGILIDVHGSAGTSRYAYFRSAEEMKTFFLKLGLNAEKVAEMERTCSSLDIWQSYHEKMFLPEAVIDAIEQRIADAVEAVETPPGLDAPGAAAA